MQPLTASVSPHLHCEKTVVRVMLGVIIALLPVVVAGIYLFRAKAFFIILTGVAFSCLAEYACAMFFKKKNPLGDLSAVVTGLLFALTLPPVTPLWVVAAGSVFAIVFGKQFFGGLGHNPFNPALIGRIFVELSWSKQIMMENDPLVISKFGLDGAIPSSLNMFLGNMPGGIGEVSKLMIIAGGLFLLLRRQVSLHIPISLIAASAVTALVFKNNPVVHLLSGGLLLAAFFMATDPVTTPVSAMGKMIFGGCCGFLAVLIRIEGGFPEGVYYSILIMNMLTPVIDRYTRIKRFGT